MSVFPAVVLAKAPSADPTRLYGYIPTKWVCEIFIVFFGLSTVTHLVQSIYFKMYYWLIPTAVLAGLLEILGWAGRLWSSNNPFILSPYLMQICCTILAPTPFVAANFIILGKLIKIFGPEYSRVGPNKYAIIFCSADLIALIIQAIGGATASIAVENNRDPEKGGHIMLAGIAFQMAAILIYVILAAEFFVRLALKRPVARRTKVVESDRAETPEKEIDEKMTDIGKEIVDGKVKLMVVGLMLSTLFVFIRSVYRTIELTNGFSGPIIHKQILFNLLDGMMIVFAMITLNILHPGWLLPADE